MSTASIKRRLLQQLLLRPSPRCPHHHRTAAVRRIPSAACIPPHLPRRLISSLQPRQDAPVSPVSTTQAPPLPELSAPPPLRKRPPFFSVILFLCVGAIAGTALRVIVAPPPPPPPGSKADETLKADIRARAQQLPIVKKLLAEPGWTHHEAYSNLPPSTRPTTLCTGPLGTAAGVGAYQHIFHPPPTAPDNGPVAVVALGAATAGWPGVVHGGLLATLMDEHAARVAAAAPGPPGVRRRGALTARLEVAYQRACRTGGFYVLRGRVLREDELAPSERGKRDRKVWVDVWVETPEGQECVRGRALFVVPKGDGGEALRPLEEGF